MTLPPEVDGARIDAQRQEQLPREEVGQMVTEVLGLSPAPRTGTCSVDVMGYSVLRVDIGSMGIDRMHQPGCYTDGVADEPRRPHDAVRPAPDRADGPPGRGRAAARPRSDTLSSAKRGRRGSGVTRFAGPTTGGVMQERQGPKRARRREKPPQVSERVADYLDFSELILGDFAADARWHHAHRTEPHEDDFRVFSHMAGPDEMLIDVGANIGTTVRSFRIINATAPIVSFEPGWWLEPALATMRELEPPLTYHLVGLGERNEMIDLYIPCVDRKPDFYLASTDPTRFEEDHPSRMRQHLSAPATSEFAICRVAITVAPLDGFALAPTILKIDVEGYEAPVLRGAAQTIDAHRPLILIEGANRDAAVVDIMRRMRYRFCGRDGDELRVSGTTSTETNGFYVARERIDEYRQRGLLGWDRADRYVAQAAEGLAARTRSNSRAPSHQRPGEVPPISRFTQSKTLKSRMRHGQYPDCPTY